MLRYVGRRVKWHCNLCVYRCWHDNFINRINKTL